jgi:ribonucleoside-triphosphate reductase
MSMTMTITERERFHLSDDFVESYAERQPPFGFPIGGGNTMGEITWYTKYARVKDDGTKERWYEGCRRVVEGVYSIV